MCLHRCFASTVTSRTSNTRIALTHKNKETFFIELAISIFGMKWLWKRRGKSRRSDELELIMSVCFLLRFVHVRSVLRRKRDLMDIRLNL